MGWPIGIWIIEENAAQRYLFQHTFVQEWMKEYRVHIKGHQTDRTKADEEFGPQSLRPRYRQGRVDLPFSQDDMRTRSAINELKQELTEWPDAPTQDMVMGHWFLEANRYKLPKGLKVPTAISGPLRHPYEDIVSERMRQDSIRERTSSRGLPDVSPGHHSARVRRRSR